ncbi:MAG TPA: RNA polymerase-binding protein DksA [Candidatus Limnocylindrales bacterium]|nr:RNA polymerase-binding protein DksA [Candidatus Limnocylindrales bacterium]
MGRFQYTEEQLEAFRRILLAQRTQLLEEAGKAVTRMGDTSETFADPADRAAWESDSTRDLRIGDRKRKLMDKIDEALARLQDGTFGECDECGEMITVGRLKARPVTTLCIECKAKQEADELRANRL